MDIEELIQSEWFLSRPKKVQGAILKYPPGKYKLKTTGHIVRLYSYSENTDGTCNTCSVTISHLDNDHLAFERTVFGIGLEDLEKAETKSEWVN